jgi:hypothetical protein
MFESLFLTSEGPGSKQLFGIFRDGSVLRIDPRSGNLTLFGSLLPNGPGQDKRGVISTAVDQIGGRLFAFTKQSVFTKMWQVATMSLDNGTVTTRALQPIHDPSFVFDLSNLFATSWVPTINRLVVFAASIYDSILYIDPLDGTGSYCIQNMQNVNYKWRNENDTFDSDFWKNDSFDVVSSNLYFQATVNQKFGQIQLVHLNFPRGSKPNKRVYVEQDADMQFGFSGLKYVRCIGKCEQP